ncbi:MAG: MFS transporter [Actinobacteria bacterium]|nr:MAG: MFS transporter [Actinomycetota bacterium]
MSSTTGPGAAFALVRQRNFGPYFFGNALSASGGWFQNLAASLLVYRLTHSPFLLGLLNFCQFIPVLVLVPWTGSAADRFDRRRLLLAAQTTAAALAAILSVLAWSGLATAWVVILFALGLGVTSAASIPAQQALIASLVDRESLPTAVALNSMTYNLARAIGPALGAASVEYLGIPASFLLNSFSYLVFVGALLAIRPRAQETAARETSRLRDALGLLRDDPRLLAFLIVVAAVGFASDPVNTLAPAFAHAFGRKDTVAGFIIGAFGAGAVTAALFVAGRVAGSRKRMAITLTLLGGGVIAFALSPWLPLGFVLLFVAGFGYLASNTSATTRLQLGVSEAQRGRMMALWGVAFLGLRPLASLADGAIASAAGVRTAGVILALPALAGVVVLVLVGQRERGREHRLVQPLAARREAQGEDGHGPPAGERGRDVVADHRAPGGREPAERDRP